jgi:hypothetical protein
MDRRNLSRLGFKFEDLIEAIFVRQGFDVRGREPRADPAHDFVVATPALTAVVEVKLYTSIRAASGSLVQALEHLERARISVSAEFGILVTNSRLTPNQKSQLGRYSKLRIFDFDVVAALAANDAGHALEFEEINRNALVFRGEDLPTAEPVNLGPMIEELGGTEPEEPSPSGAGLTEPQGKGAQFCLDIHNVESSKGKPFEKACEAAIRYLFEDELVAFDDQFGSHTGQHYFDLVARIASKEDFWQALITDFRARYIVFEFKNYKDQITQREIYTTEKYLYPVAMRGAAIIVSRHGSDAGADKAMRGALRESGKLILSLSVDELCGMLHARDAGSDHLVTLVEKLDGMLMGLER